MWLQQQLTNRIENLALFQEPRFRGQRPCL